MHNLPLNVTADVIETCTEDAPNGYARICVGNITIAEIPMDADIGYYYGDGYEDYVRDVVGRSIVNYLQDLLPTKAPQHI